MSKSNCSKQIINKFKSEISTLIRARYSLICLTTHEETRALDILQELSQERKSNLFVWSRTEGIVLNSSVVASVTDPMAVLKWYEDSKDRSLLVLKDFHPYLKEPTLVRKVRDLGHQLKQSQKNILFLSPVFPVPSELAKTVTLVEMPLPSREEIDELVEKVVPVIAVENRLGVAERDALTDAFTGLTHDEIENVLAKSLVASGTLDKRLIHDEKKQIVKKSSVLEFVETSDLLSEIGGLSELKKWLGVRKAGYSAAARAIGLPMPKGILLVGLPGCGKSLTSMTVSRMWELPLLRLDLGRVFSGLVGSSENNIRDAIKTAEAVAPCILWMDEIEKGLSGSKSGSSDGGTASRVFGTLLTWMQEKKSAVFVMATANDISQIPPEFLRKGRFDEIFFVDLPNAEERLEIFKLQLERYQWRVEGWNPDAVVERTEGFSGAEIEQVIIEARYSAFAEEVALQQGHLISAAQATVPLSKTMKDRIDELRDWAKDRARPASSVTNIDRTDAFHTRARSLELSG